MPGYRCIRFLTFSLMIILSLGTAGNNPLIAGSNNTGSAAVVQRVVIVKFNADISDAGGLQKSDPRLAALLSENQIQALDPVFRQTPLRKTAAVPQNIYYARYSGDESPHSVAARLSRSPLVVYAEPQYIHFTHVLPNDSLYHRQNNYYNLVEAPAAWDVVKGENGSALIAIVDGGTQISHRDLQANIWSNPGEIPNNQYDDDGNGYIDDVYGWAFATESGDPTGYVNTPFNADHGTHTAGIAAAVTNNTSGVAGISWNARIMGVNAGYVSGDRSIVYGFPGIIYAAENGADVISCSWGRLGSPSLFEQETIDYATNLGAVVVAAAGNDASTLSHYPSSYRNVVSVANTDIYDNREASSNYGADIDIAAPGQFIYSTFNNNNYGYATGTSMSAPMVSGAVALVKTQHPDWSGIQAAEQVRVTGDSLSQFSGLFGKKRLNVRRAVTETAASVRLLDFTFTESNGNGIVEPGEQVEILVSLKNYLIPLQNLDLTLVSADPYLTVNEGNVAVSAMATLEEATTSTPFVCTVSASAPSSHKIQFDLQLASGSYRDTETFAITVLPSYGDITTNNLDLTITNVGRIGHIDPDKPEEGVGFRYKGGPNLLYEGALITGTAETRLSNAARSVGSANDQDFAVTPDGDININAPGILSDQESVGIFNDRQSNTPMPIEIMQTTYAWTDSSQNDYVIFLYVVKNKSAEALENFHFGLFFDWDIDGEFYATNKVGYDPLRKLGYCYDSGAGPATWVGVSSLSDVPVSFRAIVNDDTSPINPDWGIYDGFTDAKKWDAISGGVVYQDAGPEDVSFVIGNGPLNLPPYGIFRLAYAMIAGNDSVALVQHADSALAKWSGLQITGFENPGIEPSALTFQLMPNYPNPFNPDTHIEYRLKENGPIDLEIFDMRGQRVITLVKGYQKAGSYKTIWDGTNARGEKVASGTYILRLKTDKFVQSGKMQLLR